MMEIGNGVMMEWRNDGIIPKYWNAEIQQLYYSEMMKLIRKSWDDENNEFMTFFLNYEIMKQ